MTSKTKPIDADTGPESPVSITPIVSEAPSNIDQPAPDDLESLWFAIRQRFDSRDHAVPLHMRSTYAVVRWIFRRWASAGGAR